MNGKLQHIWILEVPKWKGEKLLFRIRVETYNLNFQYIDIPVSYNWVKKKAYLSIKAIKECKDFSWMVGSFTIAIAKGEKVRLTSVTHHCYTYIPMDEFEGQMRNLLRIINGTN